MNIPISDFLLFFRPSTWEKADRHCKSLGMTLLQYARGNNDFFVKNHHYNMALSLGDIMYLGLTRNKEVTFDLFDNLYIMSFIIAYSCWTSHEHLSVLFFRAIFLPGWKDHL